MDPNSRIIPPEFMESELRESMISTKIRYQKAYGLTPEQVEKLKKELEQLKIKRRLKC